jgi:ATP-dependent DNA helicase RecQ
MNNNWVEKHLELLESQHDAIFVYKGVPIELIIQLSEKFPFYGKKDSIIKANKICLEYIFEGVKELIAEIITDKKKKRILLYEQFILISENINIDVIDKKFIIFENNLNSEYLNQSNLIKHDIERLVEEDGNEIQEDPIFSLYYSNSVVKGDYNLVQYRDIDINKHKNVEQKKLWETRFKQLRINLISEDKVKNEKGIIKVPSSDDSYELFKLKLVYHGVDNDVQIVTDHKSKDDNKLRNELIIIEDIVKKCKRKFELFVIKTTLDKEYRNDFVDILSEYWGSDKFRKLVFYKDPDYSSEKIELEQGAVIEEIIKNAEQAIDGNDFVDIFLTAPTGAGKSVLFQIPAIYLAKKYELVTIVISPLKALMYDQVTALKDRGVKIAEYINSDISYLQRIEIIEKITKGETSVIYLSPELLLSYDIRTFIGNRKIGLLVIDEAHLVTTWGRDFRVDYWFLGNYIRKLRKYNNSYFPVLALTATAVYTGPNDIVFETVESLNMQLPKLYIGNIRREEIIFDFNEFSYSGSHEKAKIEKTKERIISFIRNDEKAIVYFPWIKQIKILYDLIQEEERKYIGKYFGSVDKDEKQLLVEGFKEGTKKVILATKAFGMGVDVSDIKTIYHHAPSGNLSDYIQEVGRVARDKELKGKAILDFCVKDLKFTKILYGLSAIKQYQIKLALQKINDIFNYKNKQNLLLTVEDFGFIFGERDDLETKIKSTLLLIEKDLQNKYGYSVILVRAKNLFSEVYAEVPFEEEEEFLEKYGGSSYLISKQAKEQVTIVGDTKYVDYHHGNIYLLKLSEIWENYFSELSFPMLKKNLFNRELFTEFDKRICPRYCLTIRLKQDYNKSLKLIQIYFDIIEKMLNYFSGMYFTKDEFEKKLKDIIKNQLLRKRITDLIDNLYTSKGEKDFDEYDKFIVSRMSMGRENLKVVNSAYPKVKHATIRLFHKLFMKNKSNEFKKYISVDTKKSAALIKLAYLIETFKIGNYEFLGGKYPQIFMRINDPYKLIGLAKDEKYSNQILRDIDNRQKLSIEIMERFFREKTNSREKWDFVEEYFLGKEAGEEKSYDFSENDG